MKKKNIIQQYELDSLIEHATKDGLSGLHNREAAISYITEELNNMKQDDVCALFMIDLDNFKQVNDTLGHMTGDTVIRRTAQALGSVFRTTDIVGRLGGDEFIAFIAGSVSNEVIHERASSLCQALQFTVGVDPVVELTSSVGICVGTGSELSFNAMYACADAALYRAKREGKNQYQIDMDCRNAPTKSCTIEPAVNTVQLRTLLDYMDGGVMLLEIDSDIRMIYASPSYSRIMNIKQGNYKLPRTLEQVCIHPDDIEEYEDLLRQGAQRDTAVDHVHRSAPDGKSWRWMHCRAVKVSHPGITNPVMLVIATDVSELKEKSDEIKAGNERLRIAFGQTSRILWEVDINMRSKSQES